MHPLPGLQQISMQEEPAGSSQDAVRRFVAAVGSSPEQAIFFLEACGGDIERAVELYAGEPS